MLLCLHCHLRVDEVQSLKKVRFCLSEVADLEAQLDLKYQNGYYVFRYCESSILITYLLCLIEVPLR